METENVSQPVATVTGLCRGSANGLLPLTQMSMISPAEVRRDPVLFYSLILNPDRARENLIIDVIYDDLAPIRLDDLRRGTDVPEGVRYWVDWFTIPPYDEMHDIDGRVVHPRAPGVHSVRIRTACRKWAQMGRIRDFSQENGGSTSSTFRFRIAGDDDVRE